MLGCRLTSRMYSKSTQQISTKPCGVAGCGPRKEGRKDILGRLKEVGVCKVYEVLFWCALVLFGVLVFCSVGIFSGLRRSVGLRSVFGVRIPGVPIRSRPQHSNILLRTKGCVNSIYSVRSARRFHFKQKSFLTRL